MDSTYPQRGQLKMLYKLHLIKLSYAISFYRYIKENFEKGFYDRECILASNIPIYEEDGCICLYEKPSVILGKLKV